MENELLRVPSVLHNLQKFETKESAISSLTTLSEIISSSQEEIEFLYRSGGITVIMSFLDSDSTLAKICLKVLANCSKRHDKVRKKVLENNIFEFLASKLKQEVDFSENILILYSALIVILVRDDTEAQNQMRTSKCLSSLLYLLIRFLDEANLEPLPIRNTELIIYAIIASYKEPRHTANQTEVGYIQPKILEYLEKQTVYSDSDQLQLAKYFWFLLRTILDKNEVNQQIFLKSSGLSILFRSIQQVTGMGKCEETEALLVKITGVLVKLQSHREFLSQASNYCPVMILCSLLSTWNCLVLQQSLIFLNSLTQEFPQSLKPMRNAEILKHLKQAEMILMNSRTEKLCQDLWNRIVSASEDQTSPENLNERSQFLTLAEENQQLREINSFLKNHICVVHGAMTDFQDSVEPSLTNERDPELRKIRVSSMRLNFHRKDSREKEQKLRRIITQNFGRNGKINGFNLFGLAGRKVIQIFKTFLSFFTETQTDYFNDRLLS